MNKAWVKLVKMQSSVQA